MNFRKDLPDNGGSKNFLKLKDKESISGIFKGEPHEFYNLWEGSRSKVVPEDTPDAKFRFRINFLVKEGSVWVPKIFEQGKIVYNLLGELHDEYNLEETIVKITRNGVGTDTTYSLMPLLKQTISKETANYLAAVTLLELGHKEEFKTNSDLPF